MKAYLWQIRSFCLMLVVAYQPHALAGKYKPCPYRLSIATAAVSPLVYQRDGATQGIIFENVKALLDTQQVSYQISWYPWARALKLAEQGTVDALFPTLYSPGRSDYLDYSVQPIGQVSLVLYALVAHGVEAKPLDAKSTVATMRSLEYSAEQLNGAQVVETSDFKSALTLLVGGRVDYLLGVQEIIEASMAQPRVQRSVKRIEVAKTIDSKPVYLALSRAAENYPNIKSCFN